MFGVTYYIIIAVITYLLSTFFAMGGVGSAIALVPLLHWTGIEFIASKAIGLFVNTSSTSMATIMNIKRKTLNIKFALPLAISLTLSSPVGAYLSKYIEERYVKFLFLIFLIVSGTLLLIQKRERKYNYKSPWILVLLGASVGVISGLLGVGGGGLLMPVLILLGYDAKEMAIAISFVLPFSTFSAFLTYLAITHLDVVLLLVTTIAALAGGFTGNYIMHYKLNQRHIKIIIAIMLYLIALKMLINLLS